MLGACRFAFMGQRRLAVVRPPTATVGLTAPDPTVQGDNILAGVAPSTIGLTAPDPTLGLPVVVAPPAALVVLTAPNPIARQSTLTPGAASIAFAAPDPTIANAAGATWPNGYVAYRDIVIRAGAVGTTLADLVVLFDEVVQGLRTIANGGRVNSSSGWDIRFEGVASVTATGGSKLDHELAGYDPATGRPQAFLKLPSAGPGRMFLRVYYGKAGLSASEENPAGVWAGAKFALDCRTGADRSGNGFSLTVSSGPTGELTTPLRTIVADTPAALSTILSTAAGDFPTGIAITGSTDRSAPYRAGDMIELLDGAYGDRTFSRSGTAANPIWVKARNKLGVTTNGTWTLSGSHIRIWGVDFNGAGINLKLSGNFTRAYRCKFRGLRTPATKSGDFAVTYSGNDCGTLYCEWDDIDGRGISGKSDALRPLVYRCYFHDWYYPIAGGDPNARECVQFGQTQGSNGADQLRIQGGRLLYSLFVDNYTGTSPPAGREAHDENEPFSNKSSGNEVRGNSFVRSKNLNIRFGQDCVVAENYIGAGSQIGVYGDRHRIEANNVTNGNYIGIFSGSQYSDQGLTGDNAGLGAQVWNGSNDYPACRDVVCAGNSGELRIGKNNVANGETWRPTRRTSIQGHTGTILTQGGAYGSWDTDGGSDYLEENTTYTATSGTTLTRPSAALTTAEVGLDAPWVDIPATLLT